MSPIFSPFIAVVLGNNALSYVRGGPFMASESLRGRWVTAVAVALGAAMVGVWIARFFGAFGGPVPV